MWTTYESLTYRCLTSQQYLHDGQCPLAWHWYGRLWLIVPSPVRLARLQNREGCIFETQCSAFRNSVRYRSSVESDWSTQ